MLTRHTPFCQTPNTKMRAVVVFLVLSTAAVRTNHQPNRRNCLLEGKFYHPESQGCHRPLEDHDDNPCEEGQWLMPTPRPGVVKCFPKKDKFKTRDRFCTPFLSQKMEARCWEEEEASLFKTDNCGDGQILLPDNFEEGTRPCPRSWTCQQFDVTAMGMSQEMSDRIFQEDQEEENLVVRYVRDLICNMEKRRICLPEMESVSVFSLHHLEESLQEARPVCQNNPCTEGYWPWLGDDGYYRCYQAEGNLEDCPAQPDSSLVVIKIGKKEVLECSIFGLNSIIKTRTCGRRKVLIRNKCVPLWG